MPGVASVNCGPIKCLGVPLVSVDVDPASVADESPFDETPFSCDLAKQVLASDIVDAINAGGGSNIRASLGSPGTVRVESQVSFYCCLCTTEASLNCGNNDGWPIGVCGLGNLGDGVNGNETPFNETNFNALTSGLGVYCVEKACP